ncbi:PDDEXK family nuclease [Trueperella bialowiezensis]|uniref:VRR-NUC domain-containing protein n=1 Tax=Trueperella bialowiezensis TaxID=312285 RepID=UPI000F839668|nr:VRR-NUC domain-containing protein [Trueperella bialowiezensis]
MREKTLEQHLTKTVQAQGGLCWKLVSPGTAGVPDRLIILPGNKIGFIELKTTGQKPRPIQQHRLNQLHALGATALTIDHPNQIQEALNAIQAS